MFKKIIKDFSMSCGAYKNISCTAPCSMYSVLLENDLIEDPFKALNEAAATKLSELECEFKSVFAVDEKDIRSEYNELVFHGLDTICDIYLNGSLLSVTMNMHRTYSFDIKHLIHVGENELKLAFHSPIEYFKRMNELHHIYCCKECMQGSPHLRKALYMSGWDWGPTLPDMGIFRKIELLSYDCDMIDNYHVLQDHKDGRAELDISLETKHGKELSAYVEIDGRREELKDGKCKITIDEPRLWYVRGYGEQNLYDIEFVITDGEKEVDRRRGRIGLRKIEVSRDHDKYGREFAFVINGIKIFAMGANYIPNDNILPRVGEKRLRQILDDAVFANMNCIRVWGGGYYPEDVFYDICDEYGLLVWQDFMVGCAAIWLNDDMKREFREEAICNIKRFRNHASLGILCGNNEIEDQMEHGYYGDDEALRPDYLELYEHLFAEAAREYAPNTFYWPSSPSSGGGFNNANCDNDGDSHFWEVWHGEKPFTEFRKHNFRFCSEFGFQSFPPMKTIKEFANECDHNPFSRVMEAHQKNDAGNSKILKYMSDIYKYPYDFESFVYASELLSAEAIKCGVEHFRRIRECCKGAIYWQLNDCWPVISWSSVDYYGRYKALHYYARRFFSPVLCSIFRDGEKVTVSVMNETLNTFIGTLKIKICDADLRVLEEYLIQTEVSALTSKDIMSLVPNTDNVYNTIVIAELFDGDGKPVIRQSELLVPPKHFEFNDPKITYKVISDERGVGIEFNSEAYAKNVFVDFEGSDIVLSDNYFDLIGEPYYVRLLGDVPKDIGNRIKIKSVYDI